MLGISFFLLLLPVAWGWDSSLIIPSPAPVVDEFQLLQPEEVHDLAKLLEEIKKKSGVEISVYIPSSLQGREVADFSIAVAEQWKLGKKKEDKGLIFVIAPKERKMRIEVGYGLEGEITDAFSRRVLDNVVRPNFKNGLYYRGILAGILALREKIPLGVEGELPASQSLPMNKWSLAIFLILVILAIYIKAMQMFGFIPRARSGYYYGSRSGGWTSGSGNWGGWGGGRRSGGSSWGGGGGGFGGGGASSNW